MSNLLPSQDNNFNVNVKIFDVYKNQNLIGTLDNDDKAYEGDLIYEEFDRSIPKADRLDYSVAVCSGIIAGIIDSFFVGEFSLEHAEHWGKEKVEEFVKYVAKKKGCKGDDLYDSIKFLEDHFPIASDILKDDFGGGMWHHLKDFSHHFSPIGLVFSVISQFTGYAYGVDNFGVFKAVKITNDVLFGKNFHEKIAFGVFKWFFHMVSDMAGSTNNPGAGTGIPGVIVSLIKSCAALPLFKNIKPDGETELSKWVDRLFYGTLLGEKDENGKLISPRKFDLRTELGVLGEIGKQSIPIILNECFVSSFYLIRRLIIEIKDCKVRKLSDLERIDPKDVLPINSPAIIRMITVSSGVFVVFDASDAAIRAGLKCGGNAGAFAVDFMLHINVVGIGRFIFAAGSDLKMVREEAKKQKSNYFDDLDRFEKAVAGFEMIKLSEAQQDIIYNLESQMIEKDIAHDTKLKSRKYKSMWYEKWKGITFKDHRIDLSTKDETRRKVDLLSNKAWDLIVVNILNFSPYYKISGDMSDKYKELKFNDNYRATILHSYDECIDQKYINDLHKKYNRVYASVSGANANKTKGGVAVVASMAATGAAAFVLAPIIAPVAAGALFAETVAGLSGAALTSASLAAFGGGAIAAGGLGMAGGTLIIAGSGVVIGGAGSSAIVGFVTKESNALINENITKTIIYCRDYLHKKYADLLTISNICVSLENQLEQMKSIKNSLKSMDDGENKKKQKEELKILEANISSLSKGISMIKKLLK